MALGVSVDMRRKRRETLLVAIAGGVGLAELGQNTANV
jgi:Flp pilus assembly CpaE family ATPase